MRITARFDKATVWSKGNSVRHLVVEVTAPAASATAVRRTGLNLAFVVDASGSMSGAPLQFALDAAHRLVDGLSGEDTLSVVSFDSTVEDHIVNLRMDSTGRLRAQQALSRIEAGSTTNLSGGWLRGAEHVAVQMEAADRASQNRVIVLSDGQANEGETDPARLAKHAAELGRRGLFTTTVGVGEGYDSNTLEAMAVNGGGTLHHAARPHEIVEVVTAELQDIRCTAAVSLQLAIRHHAGVRIKCLNEFPLTHEGEDSYCQLGSLASGAKRSAIFRVRFPAGAPATAFDFEVSSHWRRPGDEELHSSKAIRVAATSAIGADNNAAAYDAELVEQVAQIWQAAIVRRILQLNRDGRFLEAQKRLDRDLPIFSRYAERAVSGPRLIQELQEMRAVADREWAEEDRKEMQVMMLKRASSRVDVRAAPPASLACLLPRDPSFGSRKK